MDVKQDANDFEANGANRAIEWLLGNDSGIKVSKGTPVQNEESKTNDWKEVKLENNQLKILDCKELL